MNGGPTFTEKTVRSFQRKLWAFYLSRTETKPGAAGGSGVKGLTSQGTIFHGLLVGFYYYGNGVIHHTVVPCTVKIAFYLRNLIRDSGFLGSAVLLLCRFERRPWGQTPWTGKLLLIEAKGDYLDGDDSRAKLELGRKWQEHAGRMYRYFMVFQDKELSLDGAYTLDR